MRGAGELTADARVGGLVTANLAIARLELGDGLLLFRAPRLRCCRAAALGLGRGQRRDVEARRAHAEGGARSLGSGRSRPLALVASRGGQCNATDTGNGLAAGLICSDIPRIIGILK